MRGRGAGAGRQALSTYRVVLGRVARVGGVDLLEDLHGPGAVALRQQELGALGKEEEQTGHQEAGHRAQQQEDAPRVVEERRRVVADAAWDDEPRQACRAETITQFRCGSTRNILTLSNF